MTGPLLAAGLLLLAQEGDWPTYHGNYALDGRSEASLPDSPARLWRFRAGRPVEATPVSDGEKIFFAAGKGGLFALKFDGQKAWSAPIEGDSFSTPAFCADGAVFAGTDKAFLRAYGAADGAEKWTYKVGDTLMGSPNRVDLPGGGKGIIAISQADGALHCVELETGKLAWKTGPLDRCDGSASVGGGRIVMGSCAAALHIFTAGDEVKRADVPLGDDGQVAGGVALSGKFAFAGTYSGTFFAVDLEAGKVAWKNGDSAAEAFTTPAVDDRLVVFGSQDGKVYGLDRATGAKAWTFDTADSPSSPVLTRDRVVVSSGGTLYLLDRASGRKVWSARVGDRASGPAVARGRILVGADDGTVTAFGKK